MSEADPIGQVIEDIRADQHRKTVEKIRAAVIVRLEKADEDGEVAPLHEMLCFLDAEASRDA